MNYHLKLFGEKVKSIRKELRISQRAISEQTGVNIDTIRKIEKGMVIPRLDTLEILSTVLKQDISKLFLDYRLDNQAAFKEVKAKLEYKLNNNKYEDLYLEREQLKRIKFSTKSDYYHLLITQLFFFVDAIILYKVENKPEKAYKKLINSLKVTNQNFTLADYQIFIYSSMELRILMSIGFILNSLNESNKYLEILEFCMERVEVESSLHPKLCHNLSTAYKRNKQYEKALRYSNIGIECCKKSTNVTGLHILYYGKGVVEYYLNDPKYIKSIKTALLLCDILEQEKFKNKILKNCKDILKCKYEFENFSIK
ncbi:helix-turn-helix transcriptional regulator [Proteinivorax tanatarense]|uniref:Helix-turn-helix transcriptional regulator n=1 Tax=Proteinivorax tanatarense TaxID=1260629 RepID=A0AAU7VKA7_9FIRM